jgi:hypothetical protein
MFAPARLVAADAPGAILDYVAVNPTASLEDVVAFANERIAELGFVYEFDYVGTPVPRDVALTGDAGEIRFGVAEEPGPCGEEWVHIPIMRIAAEYMDIVDEGRQSTVRRPKNLVLDRHTTRRLPDGPIIATFEVPRQTMPYAVSDDGTIEYIRYSLGPRAETWWNDVRQHGRLVADPSPFLLLALSESAPRFVSDPGLYRAQPTEDLPLPPDVGSGFARRWLFKESSIVIDFEGPCT